LRWRVECLRCTNRGLLTGEGSAAASGEVGFADGLYAEPDADADVAEGSGYMDIGGADDLDEGEGDDFGSDDEEDDV
jgi:hypothetical protein